MQSQLANQSARYIGYKHKPYNKRYLFLSGVINGHVQHNAFSIIVKKKSKKIIQAWTNSSEIYKSDIVM